MAPQPTSESKRPYTPMKTGTDNLENLQISTKSEASVRRDGSLNGAAQRFPASKRMALAVHVIRVALVVMLLTLLASPRIKSLDHQAPPPVDLSSAALSLNVDPPLMLSEQPNEASLWTLTDPSGESVGYVARTLPAAAEAVGYRGPTEAVVLLDRKLMVVDARLLDSDDTPEHVRAVRERQAFLDQFRGLHLGEIDPGFQVQGVSGATLTSLAMAKGILVRLGGSRPSLFFPNELNLEELKSWKLPNQELLTAQQSERLLRTGLVSDDIVGYQGPSEAAVLLDDEGRVRKIKLVSSFDNQPYVGYVKDDRYYWQPFVGKTLAEVSQMDLQAEGIEGISGATMTSVAVAQTVIAASKKWSQPKAVPVIRQTTIRWSAHEIGTMAIVGLAILGSATSLFRNRRMRTVWLILVVCAVGFWTGNLMSLALVAGWSVEGIAWQLAPGLALLGLFAFIAPPLSKGNPYCNHLCPHGAMQQLIRPSAKSKRRISLPKKVERTLIWLPGLLLTAGYLAVLLRPSVNLARLEPFQGYLVRIASWSTIGFAVASLIVASMVPMAYCRFGCPTGRLLDYLRRSAKSHKLQFADAVLVLLAITAVAVRMHSL